MATRAAQIASVAVTGAPQSLPDATQIRREILGSGEPWVSLANLIDYGWSRGIPVIHMSGCPRAKQPDGLCAKVKGRPVIELCRKATLSAWLLFILAHELGHIALGHIADDGVLIDESMQHNVVDQEETEANEFAIELLTGHAKSRFHASGSWPNAHQLADTAMQTGN